MIRAMLVLCLPLLASAADITGQWNLHLIRFGEEFAAARVDLKADGSKLTGTLNELKLQGTLDGDHLQLTAVRPDGNEFGKFDGRMKGDEITGTVKQGDDEFGWKASRVKEIAASPQKRVFEPTVFHRNFSGAIP